MKLISFVVPCYNSEKYLQKNLESLLVAGDECEIIVVNDGSTDGTLSIAQEYQKNYPSVVKVIDKENGGHGSGVNAGLKNATGLYFKVVDSDDWLDEAATKKLLQHIRSHPDDCPDIYITDISKEMVDIGTNKVLTYTKFFCKDQTTTWNKVKKFGAIDTLIMHNMVYKTEILKKSGIVLPEHTFYVDNIVAYAPLPLTKTVHYMDIPLYRYYIGRSDQSVTAENITKRYRQQIRVMLEMVRYCSYDTITSCPKGLKKYMFHYLSQIMSLTVMFTTNGKDNRKERKQDLKQMWATIKQTDKKLYRFLRHRSINCFINWMPFGMQGRVSWWCYKIVCKRLGYE